MGTFRRSRSPGALPLIPALMDSFRKLNTRYRTPGGGEGGRGGGVFLRALLSLGCLYSLLEVV